MASSKPNSIAPRAISPKPLILNGSAGDPVKNFPAREEEGDSTGEAVLAARGREREAIDNGLKPPRRNGSTNLSPSPSRWKPRPVSAITPAVTVQPPQSPAKMKTLNLNLATTSTYLSADAPLSSTSGSSSPRHFRIPSRPHTPLLEQMKTPSLSSSRPPSPPPPRRSGEFRRDASNKVAPPVNRAEKPKIAHKPTSLKLEAAPISPPQDKSPFSTPPGSDSGPEQELLAPALPPNRPRTGVETEPITPRMFDPPPVHHMVISKRRDQETNGLGRGHISPQVTGDGRPALPSRPQAEVSKPRQLPPTSMLPPPAPRVSMDRARPAVVGAETPPKRVFSTPTTQLQTPPRTHGRSMTVDRASERTPAEFRTPLPSNTYAEPLQSTDSAPSATHKKEALSQHTIEYPDTSYSNRRPPCFKKGVQELSTKYDTRIYDVCGEFLCTSGHLTRVWSLLDGEVIMSLAHTEGIKIISVAFKPASNIKDEGSRLWLGNNIGELIEVDVKSQSVVTSKVNAHTRREVIKIYRHKNEMWTLDDGGTLHLWAPDSTGSPSLSNPYQSFRVPKGHTFSIVIGDELWHATGKEIRIFMPTVDNSAQFQILQRPLSQSNCGDVTSGTILSTQPDRVYFGHVDGKISMYSRHDYSCLGVINISVYKITSLVGVGGNIWAGFSTGMIYVYDPSHSPWVVKKDWRAHQGPLISMHADRSSFWSLDRAQVISLGQDNMVRVWDGILQEDWIGMCNLVERLLEADSIIEAQMQSQEADFSELKPIKTLVMTWNAGASTPYHLQHSEQDSKFFRDLLQSSDCPDILVFGFQELVDLEDKRTTASGSKKLLRGQR
jgi:hypothetical protein